MPTTLSRDEIVDRHKHLLIGGDPSKGMVKAAKAPPTWNKDKRMATFVMSTEARDRDGDVVKTDGIDTADFDKNPIALWMHKGSDPIGTWSNLVKNLTGRPKRLEGDLLVMSEGVDEAADRAARLIDAGVIRTCSIGFMIDWNEVEYDYDEEKRLGTFLMHRTELVECSVVAVPSNRGALAKLAGDDRRLAMDVIEEALDNWQRLPTGVIVERAIYERAVKELTGERTVVGADAKPGDEPKVDTVEDGDPMAALKALQAEAEKTEGIFTRLGKALGLVKEPPPKPLPPPPPAALTADEKAAILAGAESVIAKARAA